MCRPTHETVADLGLRQLSRRAPCRSVQRDAAAAAAYYRAALRSDPNNTELLERAFLSVLADGDVDEAVRLAERSASRSTATIASPAWCSACARSSRSNIAVARQNLAASRCAARSPICRPRCLRPGRSYGAGDAKGAIETIDKLQGADWYALFKDLHAGLILDLAGNKKEAGKRFERAYKLDSTGAARGRGLRLLAVAQRQQGRGAQGLPGVRQPSCRAIR